MMNSWGLGGWNMMGSFGLTFPGGLPLLSLLIIWSLAWKGMALWKAARAGSSPWFVALLVINTLGILEILYIYVFSKKMSAISERHHH
ncbi:MAG: DUF5652 family protein [bacterium]|nr:DUF5652 family protein [bacterium]